MDRKGAASGGCRHRSATAAVFPFHYLRSYPSIPSVTVDSRFGPGLDRAVRAYQREFGLAVDGLVGRYTWNSIYETYAAIVG